MLHLCFSYSVFYPVFNFVFLQIFCVVVLVVCVVSAASWRNKELIAGMQTGRRWLS